MKSRKKGKYRKRQPKFAYVIPGEIEDMTIVVEYSANAWWMDPTKVCALCRALEKDLPIRLACARAGITMRQYKYFAQVHPAVKKFKENAKLKFNIVARQSMARGIVNDPKLAKKFLEWKDKYRENNETEWESELGSEYIPEYDTTIKGRPGNPIILLKAVDGKLVEIKSRPARKKQSGHQ